MEQKLKIKIKKLTTCPKGTEVLNTMLTYGNYLPKVVFEKSAKTFRFYAEETAPENWFGQLTRASEDVKNALDQILNESLEYSIVLTGAKGEVIDAEVAFEVSEKVADAEASEIQSVMEEILAKEICTKEQLELNVQIMKEHNCTNKTIVEVLKKYRKYDKPICRPKTTYVNPESKKKGASIFSECLVAALNRQPIVYEGDKSVGKNCCAETVAMVLNMPMYLITFNHSMIGDDVFGSKVTDNSAMEKLTPGMAINYMKFMYKMFSGGYKDTSMESVEPEIRSAAAFPFYQAQSAAVHIIQEESQLIHWLKNGGVMVFNEMNMAESNFFSSFTNQLTDGTGFLDIPSVGRVKIHEDCVLIGTQNAGYAGTCEQNSATMSRFGCIEFPYPKSILGQLKAACAELDLKEDVFKACDNLYQEMHKQVQGRTLSNDCLNIRGFVRALKIYAFDPNATKLYKQIRIHVIGTCPIMERERLNELVTDRIVI